MPFAIGTPITSTAVWSGVRALRRREVEWSPTAWAIAWVGPAERGNLAPPPGG